MLEFFFIIIVCLNILIHILMFFLILIIKQKNFSHIMVGGMKKYNTKQRKEKRATVCRMITSSLPCSSSSVHTNVCFVYWLEIYSSLSFILHFTSELIWLCTTCVFFFTLVSDSTCRWKFVCPTFILSVFYTCKHNCQVWME